LVVVRVQPVRSVVVYPAPLLQGVDQGLAPAHEIVMVVGAVPLGHLSGDAENDRPLSLGGGPGDVLDAEASIAGVDSPAVQLVPPDVHGWRFE
jgi:hypothetical protein